MTIAHEKNSAFSFLIFIPEAFLSQSTRARKSSNFMADLDSREATPSNAQETTNDPEKTLAPESPSDSDDNTINFDEILRDFVESRHGFGTEPRELGVVFEDLNVVGVGATASYQATMGSRINPFRFLSAVQRRRHPPIRNILSNFEGVVRPGEMLLVLGAPGSGCTTFLKLLANRYEEYHKVTGDLRYDGFLPEEISKSFRGDVQYCADSDIHFPTLTTWQTIQFASRIRAPPQPPAQSHKTYGAKVTDLLLILFGLEHAKTTPIGNAKIHGVSGGEKKRVSICEALSTRARLTSWDNSTRGLDSSTALEFLRTLRGATDTGRLTTIASLYQTGEQLYNLFDKVCLIYEGKMAYFGPANEARQYFIDLGFEPEPRQTTADFLVSITDPKARTCHNLAAPRTASEFAATFLSSSLGKANKEVIARYRSEVVSDEERRKAYIRSAVAEHAMTTRRSSPYLLSVARQVRAVLRRSAHIFWGTLNVKSIHLFAFTFQAIIMGTVFLKVPYTTASFFSRSGVLYFVLLYSALISMSEIPALFAQRPIILKHRNWALYHPFVEAVASTIVDIPFSFLCTMIFGGVIYLLVGLQKTASQFFTFYVFLFVNALTMKAFFRSIAAASKSEAVAQTFAGVAVFALALYSGYTLPQRSMIWPLRWITYINPFKYGFEGMMVNEFHTLDVVCTNLVPQGPGYENITLENQVCTTVGAIPGEPTVKGIRFTDLALGYTYNHVWRDFGILVAFGVFFAGTLFWFTERNTGLSAKSTNKVHYKLGTKIDESEEEDTSDVDRMRTRSREAAMAAPTSMAAQASKIFSQEVKTDRIFTFSHINYSIPVSRGQTKQLLDDVSGYVAPGKLTALMGETGAGKTTLLNVLAERAEVGVVTGDRLINGQPLPGDFQSQTGYCQQRDTHIPRSTVREALLFSAKLRQPLSVPLKEKEDYVDTLLHICGLWSRRHAMVGSLGLEYAKRTTIAVELAAKPNLLLFLDEPTSGLDARSAWNIVAFLKSLAEHGLAILCTIHQPSNELFMFFDRLLLLQHGGQTVYFGDLGTHCETLLQYFAKHGGRECGLYENPAEYMLEIIGAGSITKSARNWHDIWSKSEEYTALEQQLENIHQEGLNRPIVHTESESRFPTPWGYQLVELFKRGMLDYYRNATYLSSKLALNVICGLFVGFSFFKREESLQGMQDKVFSIFIGIILSVPVAHQLQVPYIATRSVYEIRERPSRMYSWTALITSQIFVELPWNILGSSLYFLCWYWTCGFPTDRAGYAYLALGIVFPLYYTTVSQSVGSMAPTAEIAGILIGFVFAFVLTFNGVLQPFKDLGWWKWMYYVAPYTYLIEGMVGEVMGHRKIYMSVYMSYAGGYLANPEALSDCQFCPLRDTDAYLAASFNIFYSHRWRDLGILLAFTVVNVVSIYVFAFLFRFHVYRFHPTRIFKKFRR